ncbi:DUF1534 domain-containing protein [Pseudomonas syringae]|uniref:DUF1534 domain-containing protein n=1 Tax=Pseudomonas syringae TaxID=317 RepID=A0A9Q4FIH9_PSESX|nr:DUF1534 domain-containing protein [Pseudomonas syringae]MCF5474929.1 DUF1534 domain-containing protein [Pseudomonas syringae]MCF5484849.1 DUF1534 domain-containing protein [Pseudomonas syringae]MCF5490471.1 DUF1534 domain-containing protein [Pseudomonas syringae]MCF5495626.1 DUF1534 domain-containing protein [Pseudomonas syringae]
MGDALRHKSALHRAFRIGRKASGTALPRWSVVTIIYRGLSPVFRARQPRKTPADWCRSSPAGFWSADNAPARFCGFRGRRRISCSHRRQHAPGTGGSSWSRLARP